MICTGLMTAPPRLFCSVESSIVGCYRPYSPLSVFVLRVCHCQKFASDASLIYAEAVPGADKIGSRPKLALNTARQAILSMKTASWMGPLLRLATLALTARAWVMAFTVCQEARSKYGTRSTFEAGVPTIVSQQHQQNIHRLSLKSPLKRSPTYTCSTWPDTLRLE